MASPLSFLLCLVLLVPPLAAAQAQQQEMSSFSGNNSAWSPTESNRTLVSPNRNFVAGFLPSASSPGRYRFAVWVVASASGENNAVIWYAHNTATYSPYEADGTSALAVDAAGRLSWTTAGGNGNATTIWSLSPPAAAGGSNTSTTNPAALQLNATGSLVYGAAAASTTWSSFGEPTNTLMPGQAMPREGNGTTLQSGNGRYRLVSSAALQFNGSQMYANISSGGSALLNLTADGILQFSGSQLIASDQGTTSRVRRLTLDDDGNLRLYSLVPRTRAWAVVWQAVQELCTIRGACAGAAGRICVPVGADGTSCVCPPGYRNATATDACTPRKLYSGKGGDDKFVRMDFVAFSGGANTTASEPGPLMRALTPQNLADCERLCRADPGCVAFGYKFGGDRTCLHYAALVDGYWSQARLMGVGRRGAGRGPMNIRGPRVHHMW